MPRLNDIIEDWVKLIQHIQLGREYQPVSRVLPMIRVLNLATCNGAHSSKEL